MKDRTITLTEEVFEALQAAAQAEGLTPSDWLARHLPSVELNGQGRSETSADDWLEECIVSAPHAVGAGNEQIDRDLANAYDRKGAPGTTHRD